MGRECAHPNLGLDKISHVGLTLTEPRREQLGPLGRVDVCHAPGGEHLDDQPLTAAWRAIEELALGGRHAEAL